VGVVGIQGDFAKHVQAIEAAGGTARLVRTPEELDSVERLIIPGGESTTVGLLMERFGLGAAILERAREGMPVWGTCMGLILMAAEIEGSDQYRLGLLGVTVRRNAFGAQVHSFEDDLEFAGIGSVRGVFIRAPIVSVVGEKVEVLARYHEQIVAVREGRLVGTSFHPELTDDDRIHRWFLSL
jgi:5'-phosphate synthase pdxT subunit